LGWIISLYLGKNLAGGSRPGSPAAPLLGPPPGVPAFPEVSGPLDRCTLVYMDNYLVPSPWVAHAEATLNTYSTSRSYSNSSAAGSCLLKAPNAISEGRSSASSGTVSRKKAFRWTRARCSPSSSGRPFGLGHRRQLVKLLPPLHRGLLLGRGPCGPAHRARQPGLGCTFRVDPSGAGKFRRAESGPLVCPDIPPLPRPGPESEGASSKWIRLTGGLPSIDLPQPPPPLPRPGSEH
jgi:hypothetical protein